MNVLVCDDDRATRFVVNRILTQQFGVFVTECSNGLEALKTLAQGQFHFMLLDIEMPGMSGIEVLELMRASRRTRDLPVVVLTHVRDGDAVNYLLKLGVSDYLLKPPRSEKLIAKIQRLLRVLPRTQGADAEGASVRLSHGTPALVVDGDADFRGMLVGELARYGPVHAAESGAAAVSQFRDLACGLVFVGGDLGLIGQELLARKLREQHAHGPLRLVCVADEVWKAPPGYDAVIKRSRLRGMLRASLQPFVRAQAAMSDLADFVPTLPEIVATSTSQMLGMMFDHDVTASEPAPVTTVAPDASVGVEVGDRFVLTIGVKVEAPAAPGLARKLFGAGDSTEVDYRGSTAAELGALIAGRLHGILNERGIQSVDAPPQPFAAPPAEGAEPAPAGTMVTASELHIRELGEVVLVFSIHDREQAAENAAEPALVEASSAG